MPARVNLDMDVLRTFVTAFELGSFARAADRLGRSQSAVSAQLRKLEEQTGATLVQRSGRGLALTDAGHEFLGYAKRLLQLNDEAIEALRASEADGWVRLGLPQDFADTWLQFVLEHFARACPRTRVEVHIEQSALLVDRMAGGKLDVALAWGVDGLPGWPDAIAHVPTAWVASPGWLEAHAHLPSPVPLVTADAPCAIRSAATDTLDAAGIAWRIAVATPSLAGIWSAVEAGLGMTLRPKQGLPKTLAVINAGDTRLPPPPTLPLFLHRSSPNGSAAVDHLVGIVLAAVRSGSAG